jgi:hypothetical protein
MDWKKFCSLLDTVNLEELYPGHECSNLEKLEELKELAKKDFKKYGIYPKSLNISGKSWLFIARNDIEKSLIIYGDNTYFSEFEGVESTINKRPLKICPLNNKNCRVIMKKFPYTKPRNHKGKKISIGLGDRLGLASQGHIRLFEKYRVLFPVLAQQSIRELNLTGRTYDDVLCDTSWAVFQEGYKSGFGADGDHLKSSEEVQMAINEGFTMITLDCSEHINNEAASYSEDEVNKKYCKIDADKRQELESKYLNKTLELNKDDNIFFDAKEFKKIVLIYLDAIMFTIDIYNNLIKKCGRSIDFEMSIDETLTSTTPESHYFVASELISGGVLITSLAPRFCGEFQKGIDYIGDIEQFRKEFKIHAKIAKSFGYKISVHSGSDKFAVFPLIGEITKGEYHLKTAGTNWLEAVRVIAKNNPSLYRKMHKFAIENLDKAKKYYHISGDPNLIADIVKLKDEELPRLMDEDNARQVMHITYGLILMEKNEDGKATFKDEIYSTLHNYEDEYCAALEKHIGRHLKELGL